MKTGIYKPFVKDRELWVSTVNEYDKSKCYIEGETTHNSNCGCNQYCKWQQAEKSIQSFKVDESEYWIDNDTIFQKSIVQSPIQIIELTDTFRATLKDNTLINLEVL